MAHEKANQELVVIEGLDLREAEAGKYTFSGIPLNIKADGAPMRAALIKE